LFCKAGTILTYISFSLVDETPQQLRQQAEHCRHLAKSQFDERVRLILKTMADEFDQLADVTGTAGDDLIDNA
jgi:hypothetical protein